MIKYLKESYRIKEPIKVMKIKIKMQINLFIHKIIKNNKILMIYSKKYSKLYHQTLQKIRLMIYYKIIQSTYQYKIYQNVYETLILNLHKWMLLIF